MSHTIEVRQRYRCDLTQVGKSFQFNHILSGIGTLQQDVQGITFDGSHLVFSTERFTINGRPSGGPVLIFVDPAAGAVVATLQTSLGSNLSIMDIAFREEEPPGTENALGEGFWAVVRNETSGLCDIWALDRSGRFIRQIVAGLDGSTHCIETDGYYLYVTILPTGGPAAQHLFKYTPEGGFVADYLLATAALNTAGGVTFDGYFLIEKADPDLNAFRVFQTWDTAGNVMKATVAGPDQAAEHAAITFDGASVWEFDTVLGP